MSPAGPPVGLWLGMAISVVQVLAGLTIAAMPASDPVVATLFTVSGFTGLILCALAMDRS